MVAQVIGAAQAVQGARVHQNRRLAHRAVGRQQVTIPAAAGCMGRPRPDWRASAPAAPAARKPKLMVPIAVDGIGAAPHAPAPSARRPLPLPPQLLPPLS
jgi:hypothetical protein